MPLAGILCQALNRHRVTEECCVGVELSIAQATQQGGGGGTLLAQQFQRVRAPHAGMADGLLSIGGVDALSMARAGNCCPATAI